MYFLSNLLLDVRLFVEHALTHFKQKIHSLEVTRILFLVYRAMSISIGHERLQALQSVHLSGSPSIFVLENLPPTFKKQAIGHKYLQKALLSFKTAANIIPLT